MCNSDQQGYDLSPHQGQRAWIPSRRLSSWWRTGKTCRSGAPGGTATAGLGHCLQNSWKRIHMFRKKSDFYTDTHCNTSNFFFFKCTLQCHDIDRNHSSQQGYIILNLLIWVRLEVQQWNQMSSIYNSFIHHAFPCLPVGVCESGLCVCMSSRLMKSPV